MKSPLVFLALLALPSCVVMRQTPTTTTLVALGTHGNANTTGVGSVSWDGDASLAKGVDGIKSAINAGALRAGAIGIAGKVTDALKK